MQTKNQKDSLCKPTKKMLSFLGAVAVIGTSFTAHAADQNACESRSDLAIEIETQKDPLGLQIVTGVDGDQETSIKPSDDCQFGCSGSCWSSCQSSCRGTCSQGCTGSCMGGCKATCSNGCNGGSGFRW